MPTLKTIDDVVKALQKNMLLTDLTTGKGITCARTLQLLEAAGSPHSKLNVIHVAGTSGKTSTAYFIASLLHEVQKKVGLTVSPHIENITERVQIDCAPIDEVKFCSYMSEFLNIPKAEEPTYFELLISFAYWVFAKEKVDYAVIETGLGGLHDSTNVASNENKICVITDIGLDHMNILGNTVSEIALQKAGVIKPHNHVFMYRQDTPVMDVVLQKCAEQHATMHIVETGLTSSEVTETALATLPLFQQRNWILAHAVYAYLAKRDQLPAIGTKGLLRSLATHVPGRMEIHHHGSTTLILDGAHNQQKMHTFVESFSHAYPGQRAAVMLSLKEGKEYTDVIDELAPILSTLIITTFNTSQDMRVVSIDPHRIAAYCDSKDIQNVSVIADHAEALKALSVLPENIHLITGSFYLISQIRPHLLQDT